VSELSPLIRTIACTIARRGEDNYAVTCSGMLVLMVDIGILIGVHDQQCALRASVILEIYNVLTSSIQKRRCHEIGSAK
jgi:hypothetical protein